MACSLSNALEIGDGMQQNQRVEVGRRPEYDGGRGHFWQGTVIGVILGGSLLSVLPCNQG
jgi:hypothetical protein